MTTKLFILSQLPDVGKILTNLISKRIKVDEKHRALYEAIEVVEILPEKGRYGQYIHDLELTHADLRKLENAQIGLIDQNFIVPVLKHAHSSSHATKLRWIQNSWAGVEKMFDNREVIDIIKENKITVTRFSGDYFGHIMFDYVFAQILNHERRFNQFYHLTKYEKKWTDSGKLEKALLGYRRSDELSVLILGASGSIGSYVSRMLSRLGLTVYGYGRQNRSKEWLEQFSKETGVVEYSNRLEDFLPLVDYVICILPNTPNTTNLLNTQVLSQCAKKPVLLNAGRGNIISEECLIECLDQGWLSYAILDVFCPEPLPPSSKLWEHKNILITPHIAAITRAQDVAELFLDNYLHFQAGRPLRFTIHFEHGY